MDTAIKNIIKKIPIIKQLVSERDRLRSEVIALRGFVPPGHFYSPIPSIEEIQRDEAKIFGKIPSKIPGINLHESDQLVLLEQFLNYYNEIPFTPGKRKGLRYYFDNPAYSYSDAILSYCMIRYLQPKRIIEIGSGYSSCLAMDTNELFFNGSITMTFIEPYPDLLFSLVKKSDKIETSLVSNRLQDVDLSLFDSLEPNDIIFIDSTHVSKVNSDVNIIFFEILPRISSGVHIHFHDIFYPFEYPKQWIYEGRAWNESYLLRSFLQYNNAFRIVLMNSFMIIFHELFFTKYMPLCMKNTGASIWIRKE
jgi:hypothetical protein